MRESKVSVSCTEFRLQLSLNANACVLRADALELAAMFYAIQAAHLISAQQIEIILGRQLVL
jgi:hypothetical protein